MPYNLCVIIIDSKDEGDFLETTSLWKSIVRDDEFPHLTPFSLHEALVAATKSSGARPSLAAVANTPPAQLQIFGPGSTLGQTSGFS